MWKGIHNFSDKVQQQLSNPKAHPNLVTDFISEREYAISWTKFSNILQIPKRTQISSLTSYVKENTQFLGQSSATSYKSQSAPKSRHLLHKWKGIRNFSDKIQQHLTNPRAHPNLVTYFISEREYAISWTIFSNNLQIPKSTQISSLTS